MPEDTKNVSRGQNTVKVFKSEKNGQWYATFRARNRQALATTEGYHNLPDVLSMLGEYFPQFEVEYA